MKRSDFQCVVSYTCNTLDCFVISVRIRPKRFSSAFSMRQTLYKWEDIKK